MQLLLRNMGGFKHPCKQDGRISRNKRVKYDGLICCNKRVGTLKESWRAISSSVHDSIRSRWCFPQITRITLDLRVVPFGTVLDSRTTTPQNYEAVPKKTHM